MTPAVREHPGAVVDTWLEVPTMAQRTCTVPGCVKRLLARGWCAAHYWRMQHHGSLELPPRVYPDRTKRRCSVAGCERNVWSRELCNLHYSRRNRTGDVGPVGLTVAPQGSGGRRPDGYVVLARPGHPIAAANGQVLEHRLVLFDAIGSGEHPCHHCGAVVSWDKSWPKDPDGLVVDHLDRDRSNNERTNLVPSCQPCNSSNTREPAA